jgi:cation transport regulator ChaB
VRDGTGTDFLARRRYAGKGKDIPATIMRSDKHAPDIWSETHDGAVETYGEGGRAHMVAFASLKHRYEKKGDKWVKKPHSGPSDPQAARRPTTRKKSTDPDRAPTAGDKVAKTASEARQEYARDRRRRSQAS